ncbi:Zinc finger protein 469 [Manis javanica]|nr:Zinc finger protein 469 [Manis javanica]
MNSINTLPAKLADLIIMKSSSSLLLLVSVAYLFLFSEAVSQGGSRVLLSQGPFAIPGGCLDNSGDLKMGSTGAIPF